jgi:5-methylcytosine-specific restriction endonuclease McrA
MSEGCAFCGSHLTQVVTVEVCHSHRKVRALARILMTRMRRGTIAKGLRTAVFDRDGGRCRYCAKLLEVFGPGMDDATLDHVVPRGTTYRGVLGTDELDNLVLACGACNRRKQARSPERARMPLRPLGVATGVATSDFPGTCEIVPLRPSVQKVGQ